MDDNMRRLSGRIRALENLMSNLLVNDARTMGGVDYIKAAQKGMKAAIQQQKRPVDEASDVEAAAMIETYERVFAGALSRLE